MIYRLLLLLPLLAVESVLNAQNQPHQNGDTLGIASIHIISKYVTAVGAKADRSNEKLDKQTTKALRKWKQQEEKIQRKLKDKDSLKAALVFGNANEQYQRLEARLEKSTSLQHYIPSVDSLTTSLKFLQQHQPNFSATKEGQQKLNDALAKLKGMEGQFQKAEDVKKFLKERKQLLKEQLERVGFAKDLKKLNRQAYYYSAQVNEYKLLLKDHKKAERKALAILKRSKLFNDFMGRNGMLASMFRLPDDETPVSAADLAGLQTRAQVSGLVQQQIAAGGPNGQQQFRQNIQEGQAKINELKNKVNQLGGGSSDQSMPEGFKPNNQKTKSFLKRLELGTNIQSQKANGFFPTTSDLGLSLGYKLNDKSIIGVGGSYKMGWGQNIRHIDISHQGIGVRSFVDYKIKGSFWLSGGYEMNYRPVLNRIVISSPNGGAGWQQSGLIGLSKIVSLRTKFFKKTKLQLMWDFLSYQQVPQTQSIIFRVGYNF